MVLIYSAKILTGEGRRINGVCEVIAHAICQSGRLGIKSLDIDKEY